MSHAPTTNFVTAKSKQTFERVLSAATNLFLTKGFAATTMRDISRESDLGLGALYYYCRSKEELVLLFYERINEEILQSALSAPVQAKTLPEAFGAFMHLKLERLAPYRQLLIVVLKESVDPESPVSPLNGSTASTRNKSIQFFEELVRRFNKGDQAGTAAKLLWLIHMAIIAFWLYDRSCDFESTFKKLIPAVVQIGTWAKPLNGMPRFRMVRDKLILSVLDILAERP
ncbi:MAG TPA: TetR/AcrR family transcriptional regulator [Candidatus Obscuribacterales bacterium]